ncbi:hypothetical protein B0H11DRAFT_2235934 [Mycena galericulata]|nr:hypothetical protein B0H11DRAFT_2235934 [Mycena galericulata]
MKKHDLTKTFPSTFSYDEGEGGVSLDQRWREHWHPRPVCDEILANAPTTVQIVGASTSATEIARNIGPFVHQLVVSALPNPLRDACGLKIVFRYPPNAETVPEIASFHPLTRYDVGIRDGRIELINGSGLEGIDEARSSWRLDIAGIRSFLPKQAHLDNLYWMGHYIHDPTLAYATAVRSWTHGRYQSAAFAKVREGTAHLPSRARVWDDYTKGKY